METLDLTGLKCPLPALLVKRAFAKAAPGTTLTVIADDPLAYIDVPHMCAGEAIEVVSATRNGDSVRLVLRR